MRKIAVYNYNIFGGGSERFTIVLSKGLADLGYEVLLLTGPIHESEYSVAENVKRIVIHSQMSFVKNLKELYEYLNRNKVEVCVAIGIYPNLVAAATKCFFLSTKIILSERNAPKEDVLSWKSKVLRFLFYRFADAFVFQTLEAKAFYSKQIQKKGVVIPNPLKEGLPKRGEVRSKQIVAVGRLMPQKNYALLLNAFAEVCSWNNDYTLHIYGQGNLEHDLRLLSKELGIDNRVVFEGFVLDVHERIKNADIYVMTSDFEGLPNALMEAMAMGFPVISTDCPAGGPRMLITNEQNGLLIPVKDKNALVLALKKYIEESEWRENIAFQARKVSNKYSMINIIHIWHDFLKQYF